MHTLFYSWSLSMILGLAVAGGLYGQSNLLLTNPEAVQVLHGNYDPADYTPGEVSDDPYLIAADLLERVAADSLRVYLEEMTSFGNRNTGADTVSMLTGMGAARRWAYDRLAGFSDRLLVSYFQFDQDVCGMGRHRNILAVLPGTGPRYQEVVLVEGHLDSRCEDVCDTECEADGMEDNGSGSALVLELARVMSAHTFDRTLVFMLTTGEEQGLIGANAFAEYIEQEDIPLVAVLNNDVIGGIICGATASPPGCPGLNHIDSTNVRIYSQGNIGSRNKMLARYIKLAYEEMVTPIAPYANVINIMSPEDRTGRGGDHIPFRTRGYPAVRFTSANEHGDANPVPEYEDRQHSVRDILGLDTDGDGQLDSFFVDFNYLARNAVINGNALSAIAASPEPPVSFTLEPVDNVGFRVEINDPVGHPAYRVGVRSFSGLDFDTLYTLQSTVDTLTGLVPEILQIFSVCAVDERGIESLFIGETFEDFETATYDRIRQQNKVSLLQNRPNPFDEATYLGVVVHEPFAHQEAHILIQDLQGRTLARLPITLREGLNEVLYDFQHHQYLPGVYVYSLYIDGNRLETKRMIYAY
jgi:hypothetical protein